MEKIKNFLFIFCFIFSGCAEDKKPYLDLIEDIQKDFYVEDFLKEDVSKFEKDEIIVKDSIWPEDIGKPCNTNEDCSTGWCVQGDKGGICTVICVEECPSSWTCKGIIMPGGDVMYLCVPDVWDVCKECEIDTECGGNDDYCIPIGETGKYCGSHCEKKDDCPSQYLCKEISGIEGASKEKQCIPETESCVCFGELNGKKRPCFVENEYGKCFGEEICDGPKGWTGCDAKTPAKEECNGIDDNCDGKVDEGFGGEHCSIKNEWGECDGISVCKGNKGIVCDGITPQEEVCDGKDNDCDKLIDEEDAVFCKVYFIDGDGDGYGAINKGKCLCEPDENYKVLIEGDCNDEDFEINPSQKEKCDKKDNDCDGNIDGEGIAGCSTFYYDGDGDGYGIMDSKCLCFSTPPYNSEKFTDCEDNDAEVFPDAIEKCNGKDDNCNKKIDEEGAEGCKVYYTDKDGDGYGQTQEFKCICKPSLEYSASKGGDCNEDNPLINPAMKEKCDGFDNNCSGIVDEEGAEGCFYYYKDEDMDGYGAKENKKCLCKPLSPYTVISGGDCNDSDPLINPEKKENCNSSEDCCIKGDVCKFGICMQKLPLCTNDNECQNDSYCFEEECIPYGIKKNSDENCTRPTIIGQFHPSLQCKWTAPPQGDPYPNHRQVLSTPVVVDFNFDNDPKTIHPSIVFTSYDGYDGGFPSASSNGIVRVIDGKTCEHQFTISDHKVVGSSSPALGDIDLAPDGRPEIVAFAEGGGIVAFKYDENEKKFKLLWNSTTDGKNPSYTGKDELRWNAPTIADITGDEHPEIFFSAVVHTYDGIVLVSNLGTKIYVDGQFAVVLDVDMDKKAEFVAGDGIYEYSVAENKWVKEKYFTHSTPDGFVAVADFGNYPVGNLPKNIPEVVVISSGKARVMDLSGKTIFGPIPLPSFPPGTAAGWGGPPTIGDFDGDGKPEFALAGKGAYTIFDFDCIGNPPPFGCYSSGILWTKQTQDYTSSLTGSSIFDFEGDGIAEAVYSDECFTRIYDGLTGEVLFSQWRTSCTWYEYPIIADVDGDFKSEIVVPSNTNCGVQCPSIDYSFKGLRCKKDTDCPLEGSKCNVGYCRCEKDEHCGGQSSGFVCSDPLPNTPGKGKVCRAKHLGPTQGILVFRDIADNWVNSRPIWNQHVYYVTNVEDSGKIPTLNNAKLNWTIEGLNNFRQNVQGKLQPTLAPDITTKPEIIPNCDEKNKITIPVEVCNRGAAPVEEGIPVAFFSGNPKTADILCLKETTKPLFPEECEQIVCQIKIDPEKSYDIYVVSDFWGEKGKNTECKEENNSAVYYGVSCINLP